MTDEAEFASYETVADIIKSRDKLRDALTELVEIHKMIQHVNGGLPLLSRVEKAWQAASAALAQQAPTPAAVSEPAAPFGDERFAHVRNKFGEKLTPLGQSIAAGMADFTARMQPSAVSESTAPVDARDALIGEINNLAYHGTMYLSERESGNVRLCFADIISKIESHRDSIARQAAAPAEGEK